MHTTEVKVVLASVATALLVVVAVLCLSYFELEQQEKLREDRD